MHKLTGLVLGAGLLAFLLAGGSGACRADDLRWRPSKEVAKECGRVCDKNNFSDEVLTDSCKTQCDKAVKRYKKWRAKPCNDASRAGCFGDVMSKSIGMLPAEHQAWVVVAEYGCRNK